MCDVSREKQKLCVQLLVYGRRDKSGTAEQLIANFNTIVAEGLKLGLVINVHKCDIITDDMSVVKRFKSIVPDIKYVMTSTAMLLSAPIGGK